MLLLFKNQLMPKGKRVGALAQLGERNTGSVEVSGSIPLGSTIFLDLFDTVLSVFHT